MATIVWPRIAKGIGRKPRANEVGLRRVAFRLAAQTVILLLVMLIALEVVVYVITQQTLLSSLQDTLKTRASQQDPTACAVLRLNCGPAAPLKPMARQPQPSPGGRGFPQPGSSGPVASNADVSPSEASAAYINLQLHVFHGERPLGAILLDTQGVRQALRTQKEQCCSVHQYKGQDYLVYTRPLWANGKVVGAVQTSISEHQYEGTMSTLLQSLLVVALLGLVTSGGISVVLVRRALQPIRTAIQRQRDFVADAAHELRTPLAIMRTVGEVGLADASSEDQQATIEQMLAENRHLTRLVDDLSLLARTDTDAMALDRSPVDLSSLVTETAAELGPLAEGNGVALTADAEGNIQVQGDVVRLRQLLLILLDNALKHTPAGGTVSVRLHPHHGRARLQVIDSGPGIDPNDLSRIFDRFYQADQARTGKGSGLGLAIGKWIAEAHGGQIQAGNASPNGAIFTVTLPLTRTTVAS